MKYTRSTFRLLTTFGVAALLGALAACGQKGPLTLPSKPGVTNTPATSATQTTAPSTPGNAPAAK